MELAVSYFREIISTIVITSIDASFYLLVGFLCAGVIKAFVRTDTIVRYIGQPNLKSVLRASFIGTPLPLCSCSVIPMAVSLRKSGASKGATVSFLISAPETGIDSIAITYAMLDPLMTFFRPIAAFITALVSGILENIMSNNKAIQVDKKSSTNAMTDTDCENEDCHCHDTEVTPKAPQSIIERLWLGIHYAFTALLGDIAYYLLIGLFVSAIITSAIPEDFFSTYFHNDVLVMFVMLVVGIPMYVCASASTPIAAALIMKGISPGAALVFLLAGPATNISTMSVVRNLLGMRSFISYILSISVLALTFGFILNAIYSYFEISLKINMGSASEIIPDWIKLGSAVIFLPVLLWSLSKELQTRWFKR